MRKILFALMILFSFLEAKADISRAYVLTISSSINPATLDYIKSAIKKVDFPSESMLIIRMNTPGGLVTTTKDIITEIGQVKFPVIVWIAPEGASATSAGAIISSSAHFLYMANGTNIGAATPVELGKDIEEKDGRSKAINDLVALITGLSAARNRNGNAFAEMITTAKSYNYQEALKSGVANGLANNLEDLIQHLDGKKTQILGEEVTINIKHPVNVVEVPMEMGQSILDIFANPMASYVLFIIGAALIYLELQAPGGYIAGSIGVLSLILAGIGFQLVPINWGGASLMGLGFIFFALEVFITSFGLLTLAGIASLVFGSLLLYDHQEVYLHFSRTIIYSTIAAVVSFVGVVVFIMWKESKKQHRHEFFGPSHETGEVLFFLEHLTAHHPPVYVYQVRSSGEIWKAHSKSELIIGEKVKVTKVEKDHLIIHVEKIV